MSSVYRPKATLRNVRTKSVSTQHKMLEIFAPNLGWYPGHCVEDTRRVVQ